MSRKRNPYIPLFTHDIMSSMKCRRLSMRATGLYLWLLCLMNEKPQQGRWALSTNEDHPTWKNSLTYRALQNADKYGRLPMFATLMARKFLPWKSGEVLKALQELYRFKLIVVEDDAIIQPRMYRDNGFKLREETMREYLKDDPTDPDDDPDPELADIYKKDMAAGAANGKNKRTKKGTLKGTQKDTEIHALAQNSENESEYENNKKNNSKGNIRGTGGNVRAVVTEHDGDGKNDGSTDDDGFKAFWTLYDKQRIGDSRIKQSSAREVWQTLTADEREAAMAFIPQYVAATPRKQFRKHPRNFLEERAWLTIEIDGGTINNGGGLPQQPFTPPTLEEVTAYCQQKGYTFDPIQFWSHYEANGWVQGRNKPIKKWQACCVTWQQHVQSGEFSGVSQQRTAPKHRTSSAPLVTDRDADKYDEDI
jgi:hypothetical protein